MGKTRKDAWGENLPEETRWQLYAYTKPPAEGEDRPWLRARRQKTEITPTPLPVDKLDKYVTRGEFNKHVDDNARDHENIFSRLNANDKLTSKLEGILEGIREDLSAIKDKLFRRK